MKVISGIYKGRNIIGYNLNTTRPTMDRVKESLFAILNPYLKDSIVLDLFSGTGNLGIEALSNGAKYAYLVDCNKKAISNIKENITNIGIANVNILLGDYKTILNNFNNKVDLVFLDPPYDTNYIELSIKLIIKNNILNKDGLIVCESDNLNKIVYGDDFEVIKNKKYGDKYIIILKYKG